MYVNSKELPVYDKEKNQFVFELQNTEEYRTFVREFMICGFEKDNLLRTQEVVALKIDNLTKEFTEFDFKLKQMSSEVENE